MPSVAHQGSYLMATIDVALTAWNQNSETSENRSGFRLASDVPLASW